MEFSAAITKALRGVGDYQSRSGRADYWRFVLCVVLVAAVLILIDVFMQGGSYRFGLADLWALAALIPLVPAATRRLHDGGRSGWWQLIVLVPIFGALLLIVWLAKPGDPNANRWGPARG